ncbi:MAG TPA: prolipoprotein diacylglyceryl transferase family protein, partial [Aggregatilineales bacterium]|nr:prolipoprotein diacylglyceryl transferase family protein [Aggregatilineales bacterium]
YESLWNLAAFGALIWVERRFRDRLLDGDVFLLYLMSYATIRFLLDFVRLDSNGLGFITTAQIVSLVSFLVAGGIFIVRHRRLAAKSSVMGDSQPASKAESVVPPGRA